MTLARLCACFLLLAQVTLAAPKTHVVSFAKWTIIQSMVGEDDSKALAIKMRALLVDGRVKEFTTGAVHDVTERTFVAQRVYRLNDSLPQDGGANRWRWKRGGWLLVDRTTGKVQAITLPGFDPDFSVANWFRDYAAYCGVSDDSRNVFATVSQLGRRKVLLKKAIGETGEAGSSVSDCPRMLWERGPARVTFGLKNDQKFTFTVRTRTVDLVADDPDDNTE